MAGKSGVASPPRDTRDREPVETGHDDSERKQERSRARRHVVRISVSAVVVLMFLGIPAARFLFAPEPPAAVEPPAPVVVGTPMTADAERTVRYSGNLTAETTTTVLPKVGGRITAMAVRENDSVVAGDVIARIEDEVLQLQVGQARAAYEAADAQYRQAVRGVRSEELVIARADIEQAEATLETARANRERTRRLYEAEAVSKRDYEEAENRFDAARTEVENARRRFELMEQGAGEEELTMARANRDAAARRLELAELQLEYATVEAPVSGGVARVFAEEGRTVGPESPIVALVNDRFIYAEVGVPERVYGAFRGQEGTMEARILPEAYPESDPFTGTVSTVASVVDAASRTFEVKVAIPNDDGRLRPGMYVNAVFVLERYPDSIQVPDSAVYRRAGRDVVYVLDDAHAVEVPVRAEDLSGETTIIHEGLVGDEQILVEGAAFVSDGDPVNVVDTRAGER